MRGFIVLLLCSMFGLASTPVSVRAPVGPGARPTMQRYGENMAILLENLGALDNHPNLERRNRVVQALTNLKSLSHDIQPALAPYTVDPIMNYLSLDLPKQFAKIDTAYSAGNYPYAYTLMRQTTQYCVGCHSSSSIKNSAVPLFNDPINLPKGIGKAEFLSATRRHEEAMVAYEQALADKTLKLAEPQLWEQAVVNLLAITIRLRSDASVTLEMISSLLDEGGYLPHEWEKLQVWRSSAKAWAKEPLNARMDPAGLLEKAQQLMDKAQTLRPRGRNFNLVENMRAAGLLNQVSMSQGTPEQKAQAYRMMASVSEELREVFMWMRPEAYYEACIRLKPHSSGAQTCSLGLQAWQKSQQDPVLDPDKLQELIGLAK